MNRFLFKNDTAENITASISVTPSDELGNLGHTAATIIEENKLTTCLAPTVITLPEPTKYRSQCFELNDNGRYAVEINGVVQPYAFTPADLMDCFNGQHESQVRFLECSENACLNATPTCDTGGIWEPFKISVNGVDYPEGFESEQLREMFDLEYDGELHCIFTNKTKDYLKISFTEIYLNVHDRGWGLNKNPTLKYSGEDRTLDFCLAPAEPKPEISCDGATDSVRLTDGSGTWNIELNGKLYVSPDGYGLGYFIHRTPELKAEIEAGGDGDFQLYNLSTTKHQRIRIIPVDGSSWEIHPGNNNPTVAVNDDGSISLCLAPTRPEIVCDGATSSFQAKSSLATNEIEVSIDYGPWKSIFDTTEISATYLPGNPGADIRFSLIDEDARKVRVRTTRDIGLYVNPSIGFDQINDNKAYTLYDRDGNIIDPFDPKNQDHSGREFDDTGTTDDFAVFFAEAEFCLALEPEETLTIDAPFLEYKANPTFSSMFSKMSMEYNGKVYTSYHIGFGSSLRSPLLSMLQGSWTAEDGEVITPIGSHIGYEDVYGTPRHYKAVDTGDNIMISGFGDNTLLPNLTFTEDPATMRFIITPETGIAPPPEQPERDWVDLIDVYGVDRGSIGDIHFDIEIKTMGYLKK